MANILPANDVPMQLKFVKDAVCFIPFQVIHNIYQISRMVWSDKRSQTIPKPGPLLYDNLNPWYAEQPTMREQK